MLRTGQSLHPASSPASQPNPGASLPGTLASPRTGLSPAGYQELVVRLRHVRSFAVMASELLDARGSRLRDGGKVVGRLQAGVLRLNAHRRHRAIDSRQAR